NLLGYPGQTAVGLLPIAYSLLLSAYCLLPTAFCLLSPQLKATRDNLLGYPGQTAVGPSAYCFCLLFTAFCLLPSAYCLLFRLQLGTLEKSGGGTFSTRGISGPLTPMAAEIFLIISSGVGSLPLSAAAPTCSRYLHT